MGLGLYVLLILAFYPTVKDDSGVSEILQRLPDSLRTLFGEDLSSPAGYVRGRLFSLMPLLLSVFAGLTGAALMIIFSTVTSLIQLIAPDEMRGRVMSIYMVAFRGGMPLGSLAAFLVIAVVFGVLAAIVPAVRASRMKVLDAIATE